jgi:hypothetical protein
MQSRPSFADVRQFFYTLQPKKKIPRLSACRLIINDANDESFINRRRRRGHARSESTKKVVSAHGVGIFCFDFPLCRRSGVEFFLSASFNQEFNTSLIICSSPFVPIESGIVFAN